jgi:hypothetical protein
MIQVPDTLDGTPFTRFRTSFSIRWPLPHKEEFAEHMESYGEFDEVHVEFHTLSHSGDSIRLDISEHNASVTIGESGRRIVFTLGMGPSDSLAPEPTRREEELEAIVARLEKIVNDPYLVDPHTHHEVDYELTYRLSRRDLPHGSCVSNMLGLSIFSGDDELVLTGGQFAVGGVLSETISCYFSSPDVVAGTIRSSQSRPIREEFVAKGLEELKHRFERYVLERQAG